MTASDRRELQRRLQQVLDLVRTAEGDDLERLNKLAAEIARDLAASKNSDGD